MSVAEAIKIADAVVTALNTQFEGQFVAVREYVPVYQVRGSAGVLRVVVVPRASVRSRFDRQRNQEDTQIDVGVMKKLASVTKEALDELMLLVQEIADFLDREALAAYPGAKNVEVLNEPLFAPDHIEEFGQFTSVLTLTYRVWR